MSEPLVSIIIVNHNGIEFVNTCLRSVLNCAYGNFEVIFVDNGSTDESLEYVKKVFGRRLTFVENRASLGPAVGRNKGVKLAKGKYLIFLDNDTQADSNFIAELIKILEADYSIGAAQAKLLRMGTGNLYDCAGDYLGPLGFLIERSGSAKDTGQFDYIADILSAKSAASIIKKELFDKIGGFDEDFYMYLEETDLSWRVWLSGLRVVFIPQAKVYHAFNTPKKDFKRYYPKYIVRYYGCRNYITTLIKNLNFFSLIRVLPLHLVCWILLACFFALRMSFYDAFLILKGIGWNIMNTGALIKKRNFINTNIRKVSDSGILEKIMKKRNITYYSGKGLAYLTGRPF
ncbi:MAG: glycosyltransferase family 2 protein [Candidatus Omnitrophota bacterium]